MIIILIEYYIDNVIHFNINIWNNESNKQPAGSSLMQ